MHDSNTKKTKHLIIILSIIYFYGNCLSSELDIKVSHPGDKFTLFVWQGWNEKIYLSDLGKNYAYWDDTGNAIVISTDEPNSFEELLKQIQSGTFPKIDLFKLEQIFRKYAPEKKDLKLKIETLSNQKSLSQTYIDERNSLEYKFFIKTQMIQFLYKGKQYKISFSSAPGRTKEEAVTNFDTAYKSVFKPMLITFHLN